MKSVQFDHPGGPEVLTLRETSDPVAGPDDVLVAVKATSVNHLDLFQRDGSRPVSTLPFTPGLEAAGVVVQANKGFSVGDHVLTTRAQAHGSGGYASMLAVPASDLARIPEGVDFAQAVAAGLAASTAWGALFDLGHLQAGERVLIWAGSSGVGSIAVQLAKQAGAWVATTSSSTQRVEQLHQLGADLIINYHEQDVAKTLQENGGVNLVVELVGTTLQTSLNACATGGRIVLIGNLGGQQATVDTQAWRLKKVEVLGGGQLRTTPANEEKYLSLIAQKAITPLIAHSLPVEQAPDAHRLLEGAEVQGKIVLNHES
jgi:NADPH:quinone reductase-like Zn-dependent oxidoreductase